MERDRDTDALVRRLTEKVEPVRPLPPPWMRVAVWLTVSLPYLALLIFVMPPQGDVSSKLSDSRFLLEQAAALATGLTAAAAAFASTIPGYKRRGTLLIPFVPLSVWMASVGQGCVRDVIARGWSVWSFSGHSGCVPATILVGAIPAAAVLMMLRRGAPLTPRLTVALGGLAAAGLANFGVRFVHTEDASIIVLAWHVGAAFALSGVLASVGRSLLNWRLATRGNYT